MASHRKEVSQLEDIIRALQAKNAAAQEESTDKLNRMRARYEDTFKKRVERVRYEIQEEMDERLEQLRRRHREEVSNRQRLYEEEIRTLLKEMDRMRRGRRSEDHPDIVSRNPIPSPEKPSLYPKPILGSARSSSKSQLTSPSTLRSSGYPMNTKDGHSPSTRAHLSRQYATQLEGYIKKNKDSLRSPNIKTGSHSRSSPTFSSPQHTTSFSARYRFPTPPEYEDLYKKRGKTDMKGDEGRYPRDSLESSLRLPTPPEYRRFFEKNAPDEVDVDLSESLLEDRISVSEDPTPI